MNLSKLEQKLLNAARREQPDTRVPYAFEKRIMARLAAAPGVDRIGIWARALWRAAIPCATVALALGIWSSAALRSSAALQSAESFEGLAVEFEQTVFAGMQHHLEDSW